MTPTEPDQTTLRGADAVVAAPLPEASRHGRQRRPDTPRERTPAPVLVIGGVAAMAFLFPFAWSILSSFGAGLGTGDGPAWWPSAWSLENYQRLVGFGAGVGQYLANTVLVAGLTVLFTLLVAVPAGYGFARYEFPGKGVLFLAILAVLMVPHSTLFIPLYAMLAPVGGVNSITALALIYATFQLPFAVYMMRNSFEALPRAIEESAWIDGCGPVRALLSVVLRMVVPGVVTVALFAFLAAWNEFLAPLIFLTDDAKFTLPVALQSISLGQFGAVDYGALQAGITVSTLPCVLLFLLLQRFYINGLISGALKS